MDEVLRPAKRAVLQYWRVILGLQSCAVLFVLAYYQFGEVREFCRTIESAKLSWGIYFTIIFTAVAGGIVPPLVQRLMEPGMWFDWREQAYIIFFYMVNGAMVDRFYLLQELLFGEGNDFWTIATKVVFDQKVFSALFAVPLAVLWFLAWERGFRVGEVWERLDSRIWLERWLPILLPNWLYWYPMCSCIYAMPSPMQIPLFLFALSAWSSIFVFIAKGEGRE